MKPSDAVIPFPRGRNREELAFLPAALEIVETPPSPIGRAIAVTIALLFCLALAWACWGEIDIVASAQGKIIPSGNVKTIQPFETGVIRAIHVQDGQRVKAGDRLIELDPTMNAADPVPRQAASCRRRTGDLAYRFASERRRRHGKQAAREKRGTR